MAVSKITTDDSIQDFGNGLVLIRKGKMRTLICGNVAYNTLKGTTIPLNDRPGLQDVVTTTIRLASDFTYAALAYVAIRTDGTISANKFDAYNANQGASTAGDADRIVGFSVSWSV